MFDLTRIYCISLLKAGLIKKNRINQTLTRIGIIIVVFRRITDDDRLEANCPDPGAEVHFSEGTKCPKGAQVVGS